ncbi:MAG: ABC transporter substrate-binding protein [Firmicutes bacterium]|nr:ABC transporter substrate-binding protein [Bacillota bacterium]
MAMYYWEKDDWQRLLAVDWELVPKENPDTWRVHLREGVKWHDGSDFTSQDVLTTFYLGYSLNWAIWNYVDKVEAVDDFTVDFHMSRPSTVVLRYILRECIRPYSVYGEYYEDFMELLAEGRDMDSSEVRMLKLAFNQFKPTAMVGTGPYTFDPSDITEAEYLLRRFPDYWAPENVKFDQVRVYNGETPSVTPIFLAGDADFSTQAFPPATERQFKEQGVRIVRPPLYTGPALFFNHDVYPLNRKEVRQAIAHAVDRAQVGEVSLGNSAIPQKYMTGMSDNLVTLWVDEEHQAKLKEYEYNRDKAAELLTSIGFEKGADGIWVDDQGNPMKFDFIVHLEFADWSATAQNVASQLADFGIDLTVRGITRSQMPQEIWSGRFDIATNWWGAGNPHPHFSHYADLVTYNYIQGQGPGMNFPLLQETEEFGTVDIHDAIMSTADGLDLEAQKAGVSKLAVIFNDLLPIVPLWERYANSPVLDGVRVTGWPGDDHYAWRNTQADNAATMFLLDGTLEPVK